MLGHTVGRLEQRRLVPEHLPDLVPGPHVRGPLDPMGVRVEAGCETHHLSAAGHEQVALQEVERAGRDILVPRLAGGLPRPEEHQRQLCVVVQHLLEVRYEPAGVRGIPCEATCELVVDASVGHRVQCPACDSERGLVACANELSQ